MENGNPFNDNALCDGRGCGASSRCARYIGNVDADRAGARWVNFITAALPHGCPHFLDAPHKDYPYAAHKED